MDGENLVQSLNKHGKNLEVDIQVITLKDNLNHPYFSLIDISKDNSYPIGIAKMEAPYTPYISDYWIKYNDVIVISFNLMNANQQNTNSLNFLESNNIKQRINNNEYNYSMICKVSRFKQEGNKFVIYFEDLGWKFLQKVPREFRDTYIAGQSLDDAFQAICEFLGVHFAYSIEDLHEYNFGADGYSVEKDGKIIEDVPSILKELGAVKEEEDELDDPMNENTGLLEFLDNQNKKLGKAQKNLIEQGLDVIENLPQMLTNDPNQTHNLSEGFNDLLDKAGVNEYLNSEDQDEDNIQEKIDKYQEEFDQKVLDLFIGNTYYESDLVSPVLNYGNITIQPKVNTTDTSTMSTTNNENSNNTSNNSSNSSSTGGSTASNNSTVGAKGVWGKTAAGSYYLTKEAINKMSPDEAHRRYLDGKQRNIYTAATMQKLFMRSCWLTV